MKPTIDESRRTHLNTIVLQDVVRAFVTKHGGVRPAARVLQVSAPYVSRLARGAKIWPDDKLLRKLGVHRSVIYWRAGEPQVADPPPIF